MQAMPIDPTKTRLLRAHKHASPAISCRFDPSGKFAFFGAQDSRVWRWEWQTENVVELAAHDSWVRAMAFVDAGQTLLTGGYDGRVIWWPATEAQPKPGRTLEAHQGWIRSLAVSPDNQWFASAANDHLVKLWSVADGTLVRQFEGHAAHVYSVAFHPDGDRLISGDLTGRVIDWNVADGGIQREMTLKSLHKYDTTFRADIGGARDIAFRPDGKQFACSGITNVTNAFAGVGNPVVEVVDWESPEWESGKSKVQHVAKAKIRGVCWNVRFHPDGFLIGASGGGGGGFILFWKGEGQQEFHQFKLPNSAHGMDLSPDGRHLVTAHADGQIRVLALYA